MKKIKLDMEKALQVSQIITKLLSFNGIERKKVYWLSRNREKLQPIVNEGFKKATEVAMRFNVEIPNEGFIPVVKYQAFKKELMASLSFLQTQDVLTLDYLKASWESAKAIFEKYEVKSSVRTGVPVEQREEYQKSLKEELDAMDEMEYEFTEIVSDRGLDQVLQNLTGEELVTIEFMLEEPSLIKEGTGVVLM